MKRLGATMVLLMAGLVADAIPASAQSASDSAAVMATALDYIDGYYTSDGPRMERAVHPDVAKRIVRTPDGPDSQLQHMTATRLVEITAGGGARRIPEDDRREDVEILDMYNNVASVRIDAGPWIDYLHVARWNGEWKIINVLWERAPSDE